MALNYLGKIKVVKKFKPLAIKDRKPPELIEGNNYYISFGSNNAYPCTLLEVQKQWSVPAVTVKIPVKSKSKIGDKPQHFNEHVVNHNEIGATPEEAILNEVHF